MVSSSGESIHSSLDDATDTSDSEASDMEGVIKGDDESSSESNVSDSSSSVDSSSSSEEPTTSHTDIKLWMSIITLIVGGDCAANGGSEVPEEMLTASHAVQAAALLEEIERLYNNIVAHLGPNNKIVKLMHTLRLHHIVSVTCCSTFAPRQKEPVTTDVTQCFLTGKPLTARSGSRLQLTGLKDITLFVNKDYVSLVDCIVMLFQFNDIVLALAKADGGAFLAQGKKAWTLLPKLPFANLETTEPAHSFSASFAAQCKQNFEKARPIVTQLSSIRSTTFTSTAAV